MRLRQGGGFVFLAAGAALFGATAGIWQNKDFKDWTEKDAQSIMRDSPWAKQMPMPAIGRPGVTMIEPGSNGAAPPSAALGNPSNTTTGTNMTNSGYPGSAGPADPNGTHTMATAQSPSAVSPEAGAPTPQAPLTIIWASAIPVRLAVLKLRSHDETPTDTQVANAQKERLNYVIAVVGLAAPDAGSDPKALASNAFLTVRGKRPLPANDSSYRRIGNSDVYFFRFTKASLPITLANQQVEFKMRMGQMDVKRKFELKEMQFEGTLAL